MSRGTSAIVDLEESVAWGFLLSSVPVSVPHDDSSREVRGANLDAEPIVRTGAGIVVREGCVKGDPAGGSGAGRGGLRAS